MNKNPFAIRKSPKSMIAAQALTLDDYVNIPRGIKMDIRVKDDGSKSCTTNS